MRQAKEAEQQKARQLQAQLEQQELMQKKLEEQRQQMSEMWEQNAQLSRVKNEFIPGLVRSGLLIYDRDKNDLTMVDSWDKHQQQLQQDLERDAQEALNGYGKQNQNQPQPE